VFVDPANDSANESSGPIRILILVVGIIISIWLFFSGICPSQPKVAMTASVAALMATLWVTEWIPLAVTALLPMVLFPLLGIEDAKLVSREYFDQIIFLFIGGFIVAIAMQRWNLHLRIALHILAVCGTNAKMLLLGAMLATAFLSMWVSNTAATMMMVTIILALLVTIEKTQIRPEEILQHKKLSIALMLGTAYSASIGGLATLVGTPPNLAFSRIFELSFDNPPEISFISWMMFALPISICLLGITWFLLSVFYLRKINSSGIEKEELLSLLRKLGPMSFAEKSVLIIFSALVVLWVTRSDIVIGQYRFLGWANLFPESKFIHDGTVAIAMAVLLFFLPAGDGKGSGKGSRLMDWQSMQTMPWNIVLLIGGGFALAASFRTSGLSQFLGDQLSHLSSLHPIWIIAIVCVMISFLTELTSNSATSQTILPVMASLAVAIGVNPLFMMIPVTLSCSCAFMMPVATPPNAIVFGTGKVKIQEMVRFGVLLNLVAALVIVSFCYLLLPVVFGASLDELPQWAVDRNK
jgi:sodium-dependent dicarboxylate transporter 2/3/5